MKRLMTLTMTNNADIDGDGDDGVNDSDYDDESGDFLDFFVYTGGSADDDEDTRDAAVAEAPGVTLPSPLSPLSPPTNSALEVAYQQLVSEHDPSVLQQVVLRHMGSMALCRGARGEALRRAGLMDAVLDIVVRLLWQDNDDDDNDTDCNDGRWSFSCCLDKRATIVTNVSKQEDEHDGTATGTSSASIVEIHLQLANTCWAAIRDLACGSAANRRAIREYRNDEFNKGGLEWLVLYLRRGEGVRFLDTTVATTTTAAIEIRLLTTVIGVLRNITHATPENCQELHRLGVSSLLTDMILPVSPPPPPPPSQQQQQQQQQKQQQQHDNTTAICIGLPPASSLWREATFRAAGTLINMAERHDACATLFATNPTLVRTLVASWGGQQPQKMTLLHLGLAAILQETKRMYSTNASRQQAQPTAAATTTTTPVFNQPVFPPEWDAILKREEERKLSAQRREEERKRRIAKEANR